MNQNKIDTIQQYAIYYAHHQWKYNTEIEKYELGVIRKYFPTGKICNPSVDIQQYDRPNYELRPEDDIMADCLKAVTNSDILVFSSMDGMIGPGVYQEIEKAKDQDKLVLYLYQDSLHTDFSIYRHWMSNNDRLYAFVELN